MLMRREGLADPRARQTPNVLATSRHTSRAAQRLDLTSGSLTVNEQMAAIEAWAADLIAKLQTVGLMEKSQ